ncbi:MAG TPA: hypothetical protein VNJ09_00115 [Chthonomonadales bacterium]|nr:hypothetical protein [Chthonomonadales bacterium]
MKTLVNLLQPHVGTRLYGLPDFEINTPGFDNNDRSSGDHAGKVETSLLWALEPDCANLSRVTLEEVAQHPFAVGANALEANRRVGERMVEDEVQNLGAIVQELLAAYDREKPAHKLHTFEEVERL